MPVVLNGVDLEMEHDSGAVCSVISESTYYRLWPKKANRPKILDNPTPLFAYGGHSLPLLGVIKVQVQLKNGENTCTSEIKVVRGRGPSLFGRNLIRKLEITDLQLCSINSIEKHSIFKEFPRLFESGLGCLKDTLVKIDVDPTVPAKFCRARTVPFSVKEKVERELDRLVEQGIISPVKYSAWAAPVVPVAKPNGDIRLCGDYKLTVNRAVKLDTYPIPHIRDLFSCLSGATVFSKLDMSQAYAQLALDEESKKYTVVNTHRGLFQYNRLSFGISSAPGIFQREMERLLRNTEGCLCFLDDILICGRTKKDHDERLKAIFRILEEAGLRLKEEKCRIATSCVTYLGYKIDSQGLHPTKEKVDAILHAPSPTNLTQLRAYLGLINFYRRFLKDVASTLEPLNRLLRKNVKWTWDSAEESAFQTSKNLLTSSSALVHFDPAKPLTVVADSSSYGLGAVLCHKIDGVERPICCVSRTLTSTERNYAQVEREALAMVFALRKFHYYLWGRKFNLITDHKPLLGIFSPTKSIPTHASSRIQRWALFLQAHKFDLYHRSGALLGTADALSRLPLPISTDRTPIPSEWSNLVNFLEHAPVTSTDISAHTKRDKLLSLVHRCVSQGWPNSLLGDPDLAPYSRRRNELSIQYGCLLWGSRVIVPSKLRRPLLDELHAGHAGGSRMKELARSYFWWPNLDKELESITSQCSACLTQQLPPKRADLHPWEWPRFPWHRLHVDYAGPVKGKYFFILVDAHSKWVEIFPTTGPSSSETMRCLKRLFTTFGLPVSIVSDNGTCFTSGEFRKFITDRGIRHITTAVNKPSTNGQCERMVQSFKQYLYKSGDPSQDSIDKFTFNYRLTPHSTTGLSPAELLLGRRLRSRFDLLWPGQYVETRIPRKQESQRKNYTSAPRNVDFDPGTPVMVQDFSGRAKWLPAEIVTKTGPVSYRCTLENGSNIKRHQDQVTARSPHTPPLPRPPLSPQNPVRPAMEGSHFSTPPILEATVASVPEKPAAQLSKPADDLQADPPPLAVRRTQRITKKVERLNL